MSPSVAGLPTYPLFIGLAVILGCLVALASAPRGTSRGLFLLATFLLAATMLLGAKGYYLFERWWAGVPGVMNMTGGYRQPGIFLALLVTPLIARMIVPGVSIGSLLDAYVLPIGVGLATFRIGCILRGCCFGTTTSAFWGVRFPENSPAWLYQEHERLLMGYEPLSLPVHPLQAYLGGWALVSALLATALGRRGRSFPGKTFLWMVVLNEAGKGVLEAFRPAVAVGLDTAQVFHLAVGSGAAAVLAVALRRHWHRDQSSGSKVTLAESR